MKIDTLKTLFELKGNEYQLGYISGDEFNLLANYANRDYFNFLLGHIEQFQYGRPVPRVGVSMGANVMDRLSPFLKFTDPLVNFDGTVDKPANVARIQRMGTASITDILPCDRSQLAAKINSTIVPLVDNPIYVDMGVNFQTYGIDVATPVRVMIHYIEVPTDMKWNYTIRNNREVHLETGSVDPQWRDIDMNHILSRMLRMKGVAVKDGEMINIANQEIDKGE